MSQQVIHTRTLIVGSGFSGLAMAIALKKAGDDDFIILEKAREVGGTWRENHYPGAECDVASALYCYSFEPNPEWRYKWSEQPQIFSYLKQVAQKYDIYRHVQFERNLIEAHYGGDAGYWRLRCADGSVYHSQFWVSAVGQLHRPMIPEIPGKQAFRGAQFHSAEWDHSVDLRDKRVAVIGNAASAVQFIPQIAPQVKQLTVLQRSANWVLPKLDRPYREWEKALSRRLPIAAKFYRLLLWLRSEVLLFPLMAGNPLLQWWAKTMNRRYLRRHIDDPELRRKLTPDYPVGAKRVLFSDDYYSALARGNTQLVDTPVRRLNEEGIELESGEQLDVDVLIYGTGFRTNPFLAGIDVRAEDNSSLADKWRGGAEAYLGVACAGVPNFFMMYGPNTNLGHNSIVLMAESQARYIAALMARTETTIEVDAQAQQDYNREIQRRLQRMVWNRVADSWYRDGGKITNNWPGRCAEYARRTRRPNWRHFRFGS